MSTINEETIQLVMTSIEACGGSLDDYTFEEVMQLCIDLDESLDDDCWFDFPNGEVRIIAKKGIDQLWTDSLIELIRDCYELDNIPSFVEIDWQATADNCKVDGLGHHFSSYDGEEHETINYYVFRTN